MIELICLVGLALSVILNIFLAWYSRGLLFDLHDVSENIKILTDEVLAFDTHLTSVHDLEIFYGDETLGELIRHSAGLVETLEDFVDIYSLFDPEVEEQLTEEVPDDADTET